jgi:hypothetical protein
MSQAQCKKCGEEFEDEQGRSYCPKCHFWETVAPPLIGRLDTKPQILLYVCQSIGFLLLFAGAIVDEYYNTNWVNWLTLSLMFALLLPSIISWAVHVAVRNRKGKSED